MRRSVPLPTIPEPVSPPLVRVVIRAKNEAAKIGTTLERLGRQTIANEAERVRLRGRARRRRARRSYRPGRRPCPRAPILGLLELRGRLPRRPLARAPVSRGHARHGGQGMGVALARARPCRGGGSELRDRALASR